MPPRLSSSRVSATTRSPPRCITTWASCFPCKTTGPQAGREFEAALRIDPSYVEALDALGMAQEALGDNPGAVASYEKAIALNQERNGKFASGPREPERVLQPHR